MTVMIGFWTRTERLAEDLNIGVEELWKMIGVSRNTGHGWKMYNRIPSAEYAVKIAKALGTTVEYLVTGEELPLSEETIEERLDPHEDDVLRIPLYPQKLSAGYGQQETQLAYDGKLLPISRMLVRGFDYSKLVALPIVGDSMTPRLASGDIVVYESGRIDGDGIYAIDIMGEMLVKAVSYDRVRNIIQVISLNPVYPMREYNADTDGITILGKVILHVDIMEHASRV